jgi:hypothetical protein
MSEKFIFAVGMFRSGTTFLGRIFDAHPKLAVASDPYFEFFKAFRNEIYRRFDPHWDDAEPLNDYFFDENTERFDAIQKTTLDQPFEHQSLEVILQRIIEHGGKWSPLVMPYLKNISAANYRDLWLELVKRLRKVYAKTPDSIMGCKEVWCEEMIAPFLRTFPAAKCIHILRDPRAIIASNFTRRGGVIKYPLLFLIRQWRKSVAFHLLNRDNKEQYHLIQYESLVNDPEGALRKMCQFIGVEFSSAMLQTENYRDSAGQTWTQNSSYGTSSKINKEFSEKWKSSLTPSQIQYIEDLCHYEMESFGYNRSTEPAFFESVFNNQVIPENEISPWMRVFHRRYETTAKNMAQEFLRLTLLQDSKRFSQELSPSNLQSIFIDRDYLSKLEPSLKMV